MAPGYFMAKMIILIMDLDTITRMTIRTGIPISTMMIMIMNRGIRIEIEEFRTLLVESIDRVRAVMKQTIKQDQVTRDL